LGAFCLFLLVMQYKSLTDFSSVTYDNNLVRWLLSLGADPNGMSLKTSFTILQSAAQAATVPSLVLLLGAGGDISTTSASADIVAYAACAHTVTNNRIHVIRYLLDQGADIDVMMGSAKRKKGSERDSDECQEHECDMLAWGRKNALHWAVERGMCDLVQLLLERGADTSIKTWSLTTGMRWLGVRELAEICKKEDVVEMLSLFMGKR
jgi:ankyrin repeat protein